MKNAQHIYKTRLIDRSEASASQIAAAFLFTKEHADVIPTSREKAFIQFTWGHANGELNKRIGTLKFAPLERRTSGRERFPFLVFAASLVTAVSFFCLARPAFAEGLDSLSAHLGFLSEKPKSLPLPLPVLPASRADETTSYTVSATYSATGVTLVLYYQNRSKVKVKRSKTSDGKKLEHNAWSGRRRSKRYTILSFDGFGPGEKRDSVRGGAGT